MDSLPSASRTNPPQVAVAHAPQDPVAAALAEPVEAELVAWLEEEEAKYARNLEVEQRQLAAAREAFFPGNLEIA